MDIRVKLQLRLMVIMIKLIDGIHLKDDTKKALDEFVQAMKEAN